MNITLIRLPYYAVYYTALIVSLSLLYFSWRNRNGKAVKAFAISVFLETIWLIGYLFELAAGSLEEKIFWDAFQYIGSLFIPIAFLVFALQLTGRKFNHKILLIPLVAVSVVFQILILAKSESRLIYIDPFISPGLPFDNLSYGFGTIMGLSIVYAQLIILAYLVVLLSGFFRKNIQSTQLAIVVFGTFIPAVGVVVAMIFGWQFGNQRDISPLLFGVGNVVVAWGVFRQNIFNIVPLAREALFEKMSNILVVLDANDQVIDLNSTACQVFGERKKEELQGTHISLLSSELYQEFGKTDEIHVEIKIKEEQTYNFNVTPLHNKRGLLIGRLINANNITEQKKISENLRKTNIENELRARHLHGITDVSQAISQIRELNTLLPVITRQISDKFDFYHVGIFLFSKDGRFAELIAANSDGGKRMLERNHRLEIGQVGVVGRVAQDGNPRVALDVGLDATYFDNPDLPETHSEMALPLKIGTEIIGVLDVQSKRKNIFSEEDTEVFTALANQVAIAIDNARQVEATQAALEEAHALTREYVRQAWDKLGAEAQTRLGYRSVNNAVFPILESDPNENNAETQLVEIPVHIRGEKIGVIKVRMPKEELQKMTQNDRALLTAVGERAGLALESARLLEESQQQAQREAFISDISAKIGASIHVDSIIQTTLRELGNTLDASEIAFQLIETQDGEE